MMYRGRIYYNAEQKAEMWDRWQRGYQVNLLISIKRAETFLNILLSALFKYIPMTGFNFDTSDKRDP